jgi:hypothetical protein
MRGLGNKWAGKKARKWRRPRKMERKGGGGGRNTMAQWGNVNPGEGMGNGPSGSLCGWPVKPMLRRENGEKEIGK